MTDLILRTLKFNPSYTVCCSLSILFYSKFSSNLLCRYGKNYIFFYTILLYKEFCFFYIFDTALIQKSVSYYRWVAKFIFSLISLIRHNNQFLYKFSVHFQEIFGKFDWFVIRIIYCRKGKSRSNNPTNFP